MIVSHLETAYDVWVKLCNTYESSSEIKSSRRDDLSFKGLSLRVIELKLLFATKTSCFARFFARTRS
jgi:hypothetical protein